MTHNKVLGKINSSIKGDLVVRKLNVRKTGNMERTGGMNMSFKFRYEVKKKNEVYDNQRSKIV